MNQYDKKDEDDHIEGGVYADAVGLMITNCRRDKLIPRTIDSKAFETLAFALLPCVNTFYNRVRSNPENGQVATFRPLQSHRVKALKQSS